VFQIGAAYKTIPNAKAKFLNIGHGNGFKLTTLLFNNKFSFASTA